MNKIDIIKEIKKLSNLERYYLILDLLNEDIISYTKISEIYVESLKDKNERKRIIINGLALPLASYWQLDKKNEKNSFIKVKAAYNLLKSNALKTSPIEKDLKEYVEKTGYSEDKNGMPILNK